MNSHSHNQLPKPAKALLKAFGNLSDHDQTDMIAFVTLVSEGYAFHRQNAVMVCVKPDGTEYFVTNDYCSCRAFKDCKHKKALRIAKTLFKKESHERHHAA